MQNSVSNTGVKWLFVVELALWMGGSYERLASLVKRGLRQTKLTLSKTNSVLNIKKTLPTDLCIVTAIIKLHF